MPEPADRSFAAWWHLYGAAVGEIYDRRQLAEAAWHCCAQHCAALLEEVRQTARRSGGVTGLLELALERLRHEVEGTR
jgi:hypothetical protein